MLHKPISIAFVSGKGGVGKTMLAANFAWVCSQIAKTALVDIDFQNQGCTGLFAPRYDEFGQGSAIKAIQNAGNDASQELTKITERLYFLPAVSWQRPLSQEEIARHVNAADFQHKLAAFIMQLKQRHGFDIVVLDCHGGVDPVSLSAFQSCDYTLMVTEADSVTFAGTLELLNYYETKSGDTHSKVTPNEPLGQPQQAQIDIDRIESSPCVKFIINRLPSKYRWKDLEQIYQRYLSKKLGIFTQDKSIFCYIPTEELLADSFGEYPFYVQLASRSIFSKKVHYMVHSLLDGKYEAPLRYKPLAKFQKQSYMRKIEKMVVSNEFKNINAVLKLFVWSSFLYVIVLITLFSHGAISKIPLLSEVEDNTVISVLLLLLLEISTLGITLYYFIKASFSLMFFYRDKHKFQKALFRSVSPSLTLWQRLSLAKLLVLRIGTSIVPGFTIFFFITGCVAGIISLFSS